MTTINQMRERMTKSHRNGLRSIAATGKVAGCGFTAYHTLRKWGAFTVGPAPTFTVTLTPIGEALLSSAGEAMK